MCSIGKPLVAFCLCGQITYLLCNNLSPTKPSSFQIATYLSEKGWRVIAGCRQGGLGARLADSWLQAHVASAPEDQPPPRLATLELDVAREDLLEEAARATAQHLPAGEHGKILRLNDLHKKQGIPN